MGRKKDIQEVEAVAKLLGMDLNTRREFGDFLEECKRSGERGTRNDRGDYTWDELVKKGGEFLGIDQADSVE